MRYLMILILVSMVAVLSCTPAPKAEAEDGPIETSENLPLDAAYEPGTWIENWDMALKTAQETGRTVLVNFTGSDWCSWCIRLSGEVFTKKEFQVYAAENLVLLKLDFPRNIAQSPELKKQNNDLQRQFGIQGYPTIVLVDAEGKEIGRTGYREGGAIPYVQHLQEIIAP